MTRLGIKSLLVIPLVSSSTLSGYIGFNTTHEEKTWHESDIRLLTTLGEIILGAVERVENYNKLQESETKYRLLTENTSDIIWVLNLGSVSKVGVN